MSSGSASSIAASAASSIRVIIASVACAVLSSVDGVRVHQACALNFAAFRASLRRGCAGEPPLFPRFCWTLRELVYGAPIEAQHDPVLPKPERLKRVCLPFRRTEAGPVAIFQLYGMDEFVKQN